MTEITIENHIETKKNGIKIAKNRYRIGAFFIDIIIFSIISMIVGVFFGTPLENEIGYNLNGLPGLGMMVILFFLWPISEGIWGQTIGKRMLDLKVVNDNYEQIGIGQAFGRFFLGIIDYMFFIGLIIATINKRNKRIGDLGANTIVVRIEKPKHNTVYN